MSGVRFAVIGIGRDVGKGPLNPQEVSAAAVVKRAATYLTQNGAEYHDVPVAGRTNLCVIHIPYLSKINELPHLLDLKLDPSVVFVKGIQ